MKEKRNILGQVSANFIGYIMGLVTYSFLCTCKLHRLFWQLGYLTYSRVIWRAM